VEFEFSDEQRQLHDAVKGFLENEFAFDRLRALKRAGSGRDPALWRGLAELGVPALTVPAAFGGLGFGPVETLALMDACGPSLLLEPIVSSAVIATALLREHATAPRAADLLRALARGDTIATLAHFESESRLDSPYVGTQARPAGEGWRLEGHKAVVLHAPVADVLILSARTAGAASEPDGIALFLVPRETAGLRLDEYLLVDGQPAADVYLRSVELPAGSRLDGGGTALPAIEAAIDVGLAAQCAEAVAIMQALLDATVEYLRTRQQFGQPIGRFQALQHRVADMLIHLEQARSMSYLAAQHCTSTDANERRSALSAAKVIIGEASRFVGQQAVQLHGGMGMTDELKISHWFKRLTAIEVMFGDTDSNLQRYTTRARGGAVH